MAAKKSFTKWLQQEFNKQGAGLKVTGVNDAATQKAIGEFQQAMGLEVTGTATDATMAAYRKVKSFGHIPAGGSLGPPNARAGALPATVPPPLAPMAASGVTVPSADMSGPGGSPGAPAPRMPSPTENAEYWAGDIGQPPDWAGKGWSGTDVTSGNSALAGGLLNYRPPDDPIMPPTRDEPPGYAQIDPAMLGLQDPAGTTTSEPTPGPIQSYMPPVQPNFDMANPQPPVQPTLQSMGGNIQEMISQLTGGASPPQAGAMQDQAKQELMMRLLQMRGQ